MSEKQFDLEGSVAEINARLEKVSQYEGKANEMRISAGQILLEAKTEVLRRKADGTEITWKGWVEGNIKRSYRDVNRCIKLITSGDPEGALDEERQKNKEGMAKTREAEKVSDVDPTAGIDGDIEEQAKKDADATFEAHKDKLTVSDIVDEVDEILADEPQSDFEMLKQRFAYWLKHTATFQDLLDITSYVEIPPIPKVEGEVKGTAEPVTRGAAIKPEVEEPTDEPEEEPTIEETLTELDPEKDLEFGEVDHDEDPEDDDENGPVREGFEEVDLVNDDVDLSDMPDFLKRG